MPCFDDIAVQVSINFEAVAKSDDVCLFVREIKGVDHQDGSQNSDQASVFDRKHDRKKGYFWRSKYPDASWRTAERAQESLIRVKQNYCF